jgi:hypothetical protein
VLTKQIKFVRDLHDDFFITEKKILREVGKLQKKARTDFKKLLRKTNRRAKVEFSSLYDEAFSKTWKAEIEVALENHAFEEDEFIRFCQLASESIGVTFIPSFHRPNSTFRE